MAGVTLAPDKLFVRKELGRGSTHQQIADAWERKAGIRVSRTTVTMAIARYGLDHRSTPRYEDLLPWHVRDEHKMHYDARMLRHEGRLRAGLSLRPTDAQRLATWRQQLREANAVIHYDARTPEGFWWLRRRKSDGDDLIRRPKQK